MKKKLKVLILTGILLLGATIYSQQHVKLSPKPTPAPSIQPELPSSDLTNEERFILAPPSVEASRGAKQKHAQTVKKLAKEGDVLEIKDCHPTPLVLRLRQGAEFKVRNDDATSRKLVIDENHNYQVPAKGDVTIKAEFKYGTGDYGYVCEGVGMVGFLHIPS